MRAILQLRSKVDPSLVVDAADLWNAPAAVLARLGEQAEIDLLLALRRGAAVWPLLERALHDARPGTLDAEDEDEEAFELLGDAAQDLTAAAFEVLWPAGVFTSAIELRAHVRAPAPSADSPAGFTLDSLVEFDWQASLVGELLTDRELAQLAEAMRPLVRLGRWWVTADPRLLERLRVRARLRTDDALAASPVNDHGPGYYCGTGSPRWRAVRKASSPKWPIQVAHTRRRTRWFWTVPNG